MKVPGGDSVPDRRNDHEHKSLSEEFMRHFIGLPSAAGTKPNLPHAGASGKPCSKAGADHGQKGGGEHATPRGFGDPQEAQCGASGTNANRDALASARSRSCGRDAGRRMPAIPPAALGNRGPRLRKHFRVELSLKCFYSKASDERFGRFPFRLQA